MNRQNLIQKSVIHDRNGTDYGEGNENYTSIKFETENIKPNLSDYSEVYTIVTGDITLQVVIKMLMLHSKTVLHLQNV